VREVSHRKFNAYVDEHHHKTRPSVSADTRAAFDRLIAFLDGKQSSLSAHGLKNLYGAVQASALIPQLGSHRLSQLISVFGALSLPAKSTCAYSTDLVSAIQEDQLALQSFWPLVLQISQDKEKMAIKLSDSDRYWIMRARLAKAVDIINNPACSSELFTRPTFMF
jgi:hypothetical protein